MSTQKNISSEKIYVFSCTHAFFFVPLQAFLRERARVR
jgi:hypothetical protein